MIIQTKFYASFKKTLIKVVGETAIKNNIGTNLATLNMDCGLQKIFYQR